MTLVPRHREREFDGRTEAFVEVVERHQGQIRGVLSPGGGTVECDQVEP